MSSNPTPRPKTVHFKAVISDLDGTLVESFESIANAWITWAIKHDIDPVEMKEQFYANPGAHADVHVRRFFKDVPESWVIDQAQEVDRYQALNAKGVVALSGADELVRFIARKKYARIGYYTAGRLGIPEARIAEAGLPRFPKPDEGCIGGDWRRVLVTGDHVSRPKPFPDGYLLAANILGAAPRECVVFEDSVAGTEAGHAAGMTVIAFGNTEKHIRDLYDAGADYVISDISKLQGVKVPKGGRAQAIASMHSTYELGGVAVSKKHGISIVLEERVAGRDMQQTESGLLIPERSIEPISLVPTN